MQYVGHQLTFEKCWNVQQKCAIIPKFAHSKHIPDKKHRMLHAANIFSETQSDLCTRASRWKSTASEPVQGQKYSKLRARLHSTENTDLKSIQKRLWRTCEVLSQARVSDDIYVSSLFALYGCVESLWATWTFKPHLQFVSITEALLRLL